jgi:hypothetical protein
LSAAGHRWSPSKKREIREKKKGKRKVRMRKIRRNEEESVGGRGKGDKAVG